MCSRHVILSTVESAYNEPINVIQCDHGKMLPTKAGSSKTPLFVVVVIVVVVVVASLCDMSKKLEIHLCEIDTFGCHHGLVPALTRLPSADGDDDI